MHSGNPASPQPPARAGQAHTRARPGWMAGMRQAERGEEKSWVKAQHAENQDHGI